MTRTVALLGAGLIGRGWAILFANAGYDVRVYDTGAQAPVTAREAIAANLRVLEAEGMIRDARALLERIAFAPTLKAATEGACYVQESITEDVVAKRAAFEELGSLCAPEVILASSCSGIPPEQFIAGTRARERCLIAHPFSPPHLIPLVELVPTRWTSPVALETTRSLMLSLGQRPVLIHKPVHGFVVNRLQAAVINEALRLVGDEVIDAADLDLCMSQGLGLRWAFMGPFETMELNAPGGFSDYVTKFGGTYRAILTDMGIAGSWSRSAIDTVERARRATLPELQQIPARRLWRDQMLMKLAKLLRGPRLGKALAP